MSLRGRFAFHNFAKPIFHPLQFTCANRKRLLYVQTYVFHIRYLHDIYGAMLRSHCATVSVCLIVTVGVPAGAGGFERVEPVVCERMCIIYMLVGFSLCICYIYIYVCIFIICYLKFLNKYVNVRYTNLLVAMYSRMYMRWVWMCAYFVICVNVLKTNPSSSLPFYLDFTPYLHYNILYSLTIYGILQKVRGVLLREYFQVYI